MQRYFIEQEVDQDFLMTGENFHHLIHVMRGKVGDKVLVVTGNKTTVIAEISAVLPDAVRLKMISEREEDKELPVAVTIASGFPKGEKLEWIAKKGTELGLNELIAFPAQTSVVKWDEKKREKMTSRLAKIVKNASEQSHRTKIPEVNLLSSFADLLKRVAEFDDVVVAYEESAKRGEVSELVNVLSGATPGGKLLAIFGPEGGFAHSEIEQLKNSGAHLVGLGPRILRTETAPLYFLACCSYQWELRS